VNETDVIAYFGEHPQVKVIAAYVVIYCSHWACHFRLAASAALKP
jgi:hypothetical protein